MEIEATSAAGKAVPLHVLAFALNIEGKGVVPWEREEITVAEIITLGGWEETATVIEVDHENNERTLVVDEVIRLKEKHSFGKKHHWKRG